tara:strand:+ start:1944 stop:2141 length:198 start_codon:yes stop_codon:yes gene_type:complete
MLKINQEEKQVLKYIFKSRFVRELPPAIKDVALDIKKAINNPTKVTEEEYVRLNTNWKHCENCDD